MKKLLVLLLIVTGSFAVNTAKSQVRIHAQIGINERDYPGYQYYSYPAWHGHYRDRVYYSHYRATFQRQHRGYFHGRRFDHHRFERDYHRRGNRWERRH